MRVGIDASPLVGPRSGVGWHTYYLLQALLALNEDIEFIGYLPSGGHRRIESEQWKAGGRLRWVEVRQTIMRWRGRWDRLDLYHGTNFKIQTRGRWGTILTIHDLWLDRHPEFSKKLFGQRSSFRRTRQRAWSASRVITVSDFSARELQALYGLPSERIVVIPNGVAAVFAPTQDNQEFEKLQIRLQIPSVRFILFVGGAEPRKNHLALLKAYAARPKIRETHCLVIAGNPSHPVGAISQTSRALHIGNRVVCLGRVSRDDLRVLYSHADLFVFPSLYEGFGMPVLEAMACGAPVITSSTTALREIAGDAAILVDPEDSEALGDAIVRVLSDASLRGMLRSKGFQRVKQFTWEETARRTLAVYRDLCRGAAAMTVDSL